MPPTLPDQNQDAWHQTTCERVTPPHRQRWVDGCTSAFTSNGFIELGHLQTVAVA